VYYRLIILLIPLYLFAENPWGKDADLAFYRHQSCEIPPAQDPSPLETIGIRLIRFHQEVISPADGPRSHFMPSSSQYALDAIRKYGFFQGIPLGCDRLMRENDDPWVYIKVISPTGQELKWNPVR